MNVNELKKEIIAAAIEVHRALGPGLLESTYEACLMSDLAEHELRVEHQVPVPVTYKGERLECGYRIDLLVERQVIVELKAVDASTPFTKLNYCPISNSLESMWACSSTSM